MFGSAAAVVAFEIKFRRLILCDKFATHSRNHGDDRRAACFEPEPKLGFDVEDR